MNRDELARHLYATQPLGPEVTMTDAEEAAGAEEWDAGEVKPEDVADCYARADEMIKKREVLR